MLFSPAPHRRSRPIAHVARCFFSRLRDHYGFVPPPSPPAHASPEPKQPKFKPKPVSRTSLDFGGRPPVHSDLPFDFRFSYTESDPRTKPIGLRQPKYSPFGPGRLDRPWTGVCAPAVDTTLRSVDGDDPAEAAEKELEEKRKKQRELILGAPLTPAERALLVDKWGKGKTKRQISLGRDGLTHNMLSDIHNHWKNAEAVRIKCHGVPSIDMHNVCAQLEDKTGGLIIHRHGGQIILYRGRHYNPNKAPNIPLMLWKPQEPVYPRLIKTTIEGLSVEETKEIRKRALLVPVLTKLAKNRYYGNLVTMVRDAFLEAELVRIDCTGLPKSDNRKVGVKLRDLVPCIIVSFDKEQVVVWRGKNYMRDENYDSFCDDRSAESTNVLEANEAASPSGNMLSMAHLSSDFQEVADSDITSENSDE